MTVILADEGGKGSPVGLFVILVLCIATYFLMKSMGRHLRKVPPSFGAGAGAGAETPGDDSGAEQQSGSLRADDNGTSGETGADRPA